MATKRKIKSTGKKKISSKKTKPKAKVKTKPTRKTSSKTKSKKKAFGGYTISFAGRKETIEEVFGKKPVVPSEMTKKIWAFVKSKKLATK